MPKAKRSNVKAKHKDSAAKNTMNAPAESGAPRRSPEAGPSGAEEREPKRQIGQFSGPSQAPILKK